MNPRKKFFYDRRITSTEISRRIGRSPQYIIAILNGRIGPAEPTLKLIDQLIEEIKQTEAGESSHA